MKKDNYKTKVSFRIEKGGDVFAVFPEDCHNNYVTCYAHIGQHSDCHPDYYKRLKKASPDQYTDLKTELESIGYNLQIL